ncbi:MAG TPA: polynucleotide adenylyltransferase PcnB [Thermoanaerobaculia bacterium]|nr:polynucleotide adenylyltransferase PcnB [Thermoanaerobaculia bacterium]
METSELTEPRVLPRSEHSISRKRISTNALKVLYRLHRSDHRAYLVGGGVRDLLLGHEPKDFDVATDARPNEIRRLFRNSRIIGRRFRLVHVFFQDEIIEVSTFRRDPDPDDQDSAPDDLLITSDNAFGTPEEDAFRRDFTVNALFYSIDDFSVIDYVGGLEDLERQIVRTIGEPAIRFQEDPVRMVRACEFAARLGFAIDAASQEAILAHREDLGKASAARLSEEVMQLLRCGHAGRALQWMLDLRLLDVVLPEALAMVNGADLGGERLGRIIPVIDKWVEEGREISDAALLGAVLLPGLLARRKELEGKRDRPLSRRASELVAAEVIAPLATRLRLSRDRATRVERALLTLDRLRSGGLTDGERVKLAGRSAFDDALALLELISGVQGGGEDELQVWKEIQRRMASARERSEPQGENRARRRRRRPRRRHRRH